MQKKAKWIHFTDNGNAFDLVSKGGANISREYGGLFVYKFTPDYPVLERSREWGMRDPIILECDESLVKLIQEDPVGDDPTRNEYVIPCKVFAQVRFWQWTE